MVGDQTDSKAIKSYSMNIWPWSPPYKPLPPSTSFFFFNLTFHILNVMFNKLFWISLHVNKYQYLIKYFFLNAGFKIQTHEIKGKGQISIRTLHIFIYYFYVMDKNIFWQIYISIKTKYWLFFSYLVLVILLYIGMGSFIIKSI